MTTPRPSEGEVPFVRFAASTRGERRLYADLIRLCEPMNAGLVATNAQANIISLVPAVRSQ